VAVATLLATAAAMVVSMVLLFAYFAGSTSDPSSPRPYSRLDSLAWIAGSIVGPGLIAVGVVVQTVDRRRKLLVCAVGHIAYAVALALLVAVR
jgi:hypothetical protein